MTMSLGQPQRRAVRRAMRTTCQAVSSSEFELLGERALDLSPQGLLLACDVPAALGEQVVVSFLAPGREPIWLDAEAEIARIIYGYRLGDPGYCAGLRFTYFERSARGELLSRLAGCPPPVPQRRLTSERLRSDSARDGVLRQRIVTVWPARGGCPAGVFSA
jgi:PilZ domain